MSLPDLRGRCAVITGASRGIGAAMARAFAERGMRLGLCARSEPVLPDGETVVSQRVDIRDEAALDVFARRVVERFGAIDLWINNAGVLDPIAPLREIETDAFRTHIDINLTGVFLGTRWFVRHLRARATAAGGPQEGVLINVSSGAAWHPYAGWAAYCAGKAGVERMTEVVQLEEAEAGLRAYAIAPGVVDTAMQERIRSCSPDAFPMVERFVEMKREQSFNSPEFVARCFLEIAFDPAARPEGVAVRLPAERDGRAG